MTHLSEDEARKRFGIVGLWGSELISGLEVAECTIKQLSQFYSLFAFGWVYGRAIEYPLGGPHLCHILYVFIGWLKMKLLVNWISKEPHFSSRVI